MSCHRTGFAKIAIVLSLAAAGVHPAAAMTEFCMQDGDDVKATFFAAPTKDTTPVRIVMAGYTYSIPRNYFRFPQVECRTGETRVLVLRMTLPDFLPATNTTWDRLYGKRAGLEDKYVQVAVSQQTIKDMARLMGNHSEREIARRATPAVKGLLSLAQGPLDSRGYPVSEIYYAPNRQQPDVIIRCDPVGKSPGANCRFLFPYRGLVWRPWTSRKNLSDWRMIILGLEARIDSFLMLK